MDFQETSKGFSLSVDVPSCFFGVIIGKGGEKKKRIEQETQCQIEIPRHGDHSDVIGKKILTNPLRKEPFLVHFLIILLRFGLILDFTRNGKKLDEARLDASVTTLAHRVIEIFDY